MHQVMEDTPIASIPDVPTWSENFALAVYDPIRNIHVFCHIGRWRKDLSLWRECVLIGLPDGSTVFHRAIGNAHASAEGPGGPNFSMNVVENFHKLRWSFLGGAQRVPGEVARRSLPQDGPLERLAFDLTFSSDLPIWDIHVPVWSAAQDAVAGPILRGHTEQIGVLKGEIQIGNERYQFEGIGNRDHSRGERVQKTELRTHSWMHGTFENGISFLGYEVMTAPDQPAVMSEACVYENGTLYPGKLSQNFHIPLNGMSDLERPFSVFVETEKHKLNVDVLNFPHNNFIQFTAPWDLYVGRRQIDDDLNRCVPEQSAHMLLDGKIKGYGHVERAMPGPIIFDPL